MWALSSKLPITLTDSQLVKLANTDKEKFVEVYKMGLDVMKLCLDTGLEPSALLDAIKLLTTPHIEVAMYSPDDTMKLAVQDERFAASYLPRFHPLYNGSLKARPKLLQKALWVLENVPSIDELLTQYDEQRVRSMKSDPSSAFHIDSRTFNTMLTANHVLRQEHDAGKDVRFDLTLGFFHSDGLPSKGVQDEINGRPFDRVSGIYYGDPFPGHKYTLTTREVEKRFEEES
jgi:hypothetical protein